MVDMTRAWRMLDNEISMTPMPEKYNNFNFMSRYISSLCFVCFVFPIFFFFFNMGHCHGSLEVIRSSLVENET